MRRRTLQKEVVKDIIESAQGPLTAIEVHALAQAKLPSIGIATVYRNLKSFTDSGLMCLVELPGQPLRYESSNLKFHHHFVCQTCERVFDIEGCVPGIESLAPEGFQVMRHDVTLYGVCPECTAQD